MASWSIRLRSLLLSPYLLALPLALLLILLLPFTFSKYTGTILQSGIIDKKGAYIYYRDLDHDGNSEQIVLFNNTEDVASVKILGSGNLIRDHFYFSGRIIPLREAILFFDDPVSRQGCLQLLTIKNDSLLFHAVNTITRHDLCRDIFVCRLEKRNGKYDYVITQARFADLDRDGSPEALFTVLAGFPLQPRMLCAYDFRQKRLYKSLTMGHIFGISDLADLNGDQYPEILVYSYSITNFPDTVNIPWHDSAAYYMILDKDLQVWKVPWIFRGQYVLATPKIWQTAGDTLVPVMINSKTRSGGPPRIMLFDLEGRLLRSRVLENDNKVGTIELLTDQADSRHIYAVSPAGWAVQFDTTLRITRRIDLQQYPPHGIKQMEVDGDGTGEIVFEGSEAWPMTIFRHDFSHPVQYSFPLTTDPKRVELMRRAGETPLLYVQQGDRYYTCDYRRNPWWIMRFPTYAGIYLLSLGFILLTRLLQRFALRQRYEAERTIAGLQMQLVRNQLDPHFTFNAINTISASIMQRRPEEANRNLLSLSRLMRSFVTNAESPAWSIAEELDFLEHYISLMKSRVECGFGHTIEADPVVDLQRQVPRMVTQVYVENAIRHGLRTLPSGGRLLVRFSMNDNHLEITVEDNGIGRSGAATSSPHGLGKGMAMMDRLFDLFNAYNERKIQCVITDLVNDCGEPAGTRVNLHIPVGMRFDFLPQSRGDARK